MEQILRLKNQDGTDTIVINGKKLDPQQDAQQYNEIIATFQKYDSEAAEKKDKSKQFQNRSGFIYSPEKGTYYMNGTFNADDNNPQPQDFSMYTNGVAKKRELHKIIRRLENENDRRISDDSYDDVYDYSDDSWFACWWFFIIFFIIIIFFGWGGHGYGWW